MVDAAKRRRPPPDMPPEKDMRTPGCGARRYQETPRPARARVRGSVCRKENGSRSAGDVHRKSHTGAALQVRRHPDEDVALEVQPRRLLHAVQDCRQAVRRIAERRIVPPPGAVAYQATIVLAGVADTTGRKWLRIGRSR